MNTEAIQPIEQADRIFKLFDPIINSNLLFMIISIISPLSLYIYIVISARRKTPSNVFADAERLLAGRADAIVERITNSVTEKALGIIDREFLNNADKIVHDALDKKLSRGIVNKIGETVRSQASNLNIIDNLIDRINNNSRSEASRTISYTDGLLWSYYLISFIAIGVGIFGVTFIGYISINDHLSGNFKANQMSIGQFVIIYSKYFFGFFVEIVSLIMLRHANKAFEAARYFSNEASNTDIRLSAILIAIRLGDPRKIQKTIDSLLSVDRNQAIDKSKKTREEISLEVENRYLDAYKNINSIFFHHQGRQKPDQT